MDMDNRLQQVFCAVVPSDDQIKLKVTEEKNAGPKYLSEILADRSFPKSYEVFLVNESDYDISGVDTETGGFEGGIQLNVGEKKTGPIRRVEILPIEELDFEMLDFVVWYVLKFSFSDGTQINAQFTIHKGYSLTQDRYRSCSALGKHGYFFVLTPPSGE